MTAEPRRRLLAKVHIARKDLGLSEEAYRSLLFRLFERRSAKNLNNAQLEQAVAHFRSLGWRPRMPEPEEGATRLQKRRIVNLWKQKSRIPDPKGLRHWLEKYWKATSLRFLSKRTASKVIAVLESDRWPGARDRPARPAAGYDVVVAGLGIMGGAIASSLSGRGRILGLDRFHPPHDKGSSYGYSRTIRQAHARGEIYVPLALRAFELWRRLERDTSTLLMRTTGGLTIGLPDSPAVGSSLKNAHTYAIRHEVMGAAEIRQRFPALNPGEDMVALYEHESGLLDPLQAMKAMLQQAESSGVELSYGEKLLGWDLRGSGLLDIRTSQRTFQAGRLVLALGPWAASFPGLDDLALEPKRVVQHWFEPRQQPEAFSPEHLPSHYWQLPDGLEFFGTPLLGPGAAAAVHNRLPSADPDAMQREVDPREVQDMRRVLRTFVPVLADGPCVQSRACLYTMSPDGHFLLGGLDGRSQVFIAGGFSGHGFTFAPVVGEIMSALIRGARPGSNIQIFAPSRFRSEVAGGPAR